MYEHLRNDVMVALSRVATLDSESVLKMLDRVAVNYEIRRKELGLAIVNNEIPELVMVYLVCKKMSGLSDGTLENYKIVLSKFFEDVRKAPQEVTTNEIRMFLYLYQERRHVSYRTVDKYREYIARFFSWANAEGYILHNPAKNIEAVKYEEKPREALTQIELEYLRLACKTDRDRAIIEFLYSTGARVSELSILKKSDIDWRDKSVHLFGKGRKHRTSFLNAKAEVALKTYLDSRRDDCEYLFITSKKPYRNLKKEGIEKIVRNISSDVSCRIGKRITPHILRHTTATVALQSGMPIADISKLLGHESIDTTMIYAKSSLDGVRIGHKKHIV